MITRITQIFHNPTNPLNHAGNYILNKEQPLKQSKVPSDKYLKLAKLNTTIYLCVTNKLKSIRKQSA